MNKKNITLMVVAIATLITFVGLATYAYFVGKIRTSNVTATSAGPTSYWFAEGSTYTFPNHGGTLQRYGTATGHHVYIGQDDTKYYTCINVYGNEVCLSQPYTQYTGIEIVNDGLSTEQQKAAEAAIGKVFSDAGFTGYSCTSNSHYIACHVDEFSCHINNGEIQCGASNADDYCGVNVDGSAYCRYSGGKIIY